jgi:hypothetical protein
MNRTILLGMPNGTVTYDDGTGDKGPQWHAVKEGAVCLFDKDTNPILPNQTTIRDGGIYIVGGAVPDFHPQFTPLLGSSGMSIRVGYPKEGKHFSATIVLKNVDPTEKGVASFTVASRDVPVRNKRWKWSVDIAWDGKGTLVDLANALITAWNNSFSKQLDIIADRTLITIDGSQYPAVRLRGVGKNYYNFAVIPSGLTIHSVLYNIVTGLKPVLYKEQVLELLRRNAADRGMEYPDKDWSEMYPGYNDTLIYEKYACIYLRTYTPKEFATVDEALWTNTQILFPYQTPPPLVNKAKNRKEDEPPVEGDQAANETVPNSDPLAGNPALATVIKLLNFIKRS